MLSLGKEIMGFSIEVKVGGEYGTSLRPELPIKANEEEEAAVITGVEFRQELDD
jgi:hypothetical protein